MRTTSVMMTNLVGLMSMLEPYFSKPDTQTRRFMERVTAT